MTVIEELHELTGICAVATVLAMVALGLSAYRYQNVKGLLPLERRTLVRWHGWGAAVFAVLVVMHYFTTDKRLALLIAGVITFAATLLLGLSFRLSRKFFHPVIKVKILLVVVAAGLLLVGHDELEERYPEAGHGGNEARYEEVAPPAALVLAAGAERAGTPQGRTGNPTGSCMRRA